MTTVDSALTALAEGKHVRRDVWDETTRMFVENGVLVQQATGKPYPYDLSWHEINATDWQVVEPTSSHQQTQL
jgi:hypothetical protein